MLLVIVNVDGSDVSPKPMCCAEAARAPSTRCAAPITRAATTSAMALVATTDFVLVNRSGFIFSSFSL
jgi:hypothetical protein